MISLLQLRTVFGCVWGVGLLRGTALLLVVLFIRLETYVCVCVVFRVVFSDARIYKCVCVCVCARSIYCLHSVEKV